MRVKLDYKPGQEPPRIQRWWETVLTIVAFIAFHVVVVLAFARVLWG